MSGMGVCKIYDGEDEAKLLETIQGSFISDNFPTDGGNKTIHQGVLKGYYTGGMDEFTGQMKGEGTLKFEDPKQGVLKGQFSSNMINGDAEQELKDKWRIEGPYKDNEPTIDVKYYNWKKSKMIGPKVWCEVKKDDCLKNKPDGKKRRKSSRRKSLGVKKLEVEKGATESAEEESDQSESSSDDFDNAERSPSSSPKPKSENQSPEANKH